MSRGQRAFLKRQLDMALGNIDKAMGHVSAVQEALAVDHPEYLGAIEAIYTGAEMLQELIKKLDEGI